MKKILLPIIALLFVACEPEQIKLYKMEVFYTNDSRDTILLIGRGNNYFFMEDGDFSQHIHASAKKVIRSGVRNFNVLSIEKGELSDTARAEKLFVEFPNTFK